MYKIPKKTRTSVNVNTSVEAETIEQEITRLINDGAPIENDKIAIYTKPSEGVVYGTNIRDDKWEKSIEISEKINADIDKIRQMKIVKKEEEATKKEEENGAENQSKNEGEN